MKGGWYTIATVLVATFVVVTAKDTTLLPIPTKCPRYDSPDSVVVHIAHETDCTKFYTCDHGAKILMDCPLMNKKGKRLHFNPLLQVCDWPNRAGCKSSGSTPTTTPIPATEPTPTTSTTSTAKPDIPDVPEVYCPDKDYSPPLKFAHPCSCEKYYLCNRGELRLRQCTNGEHFSVKKGICVKASVADCIQKARDWY